MSVGWIISGIYLFQSPLLLAGSWLTQALMRKGWSQRICLGYASGVALLVPGIALAASVYAGTGAVQLVLIAIAFAAPSLTTIFGPVILGAVAPASQRGRLIVVIYSANAISGLVSNAVTGWIVQGAGAGPAGFADAMLFSSGILIIGAIAAFAMLFPERTATRFARSSAGPIRA